MLEVITASGAIIHVDPTVSAQMQMLPVAISAFGGETFRAETQVEEATA